MLCIYVSIYAMYICIYTYNAIYVIISYVFIYNIMPPCVM